MAYRWNAVKIPRFYGLDLKTNPIDVKDGVSLDAVNVFQDLHGVISKRLGFDVMFEADETATSPIHEVGQCTLGGVKYYFKFVGDNFKYSFFINGATTTVAIPNGIDGIVFWAVMNDKLYFVDGVNELRYFDGATVAESSIYERPTFAPTLAAGGAGPATFTFVYTVDNGLGESPQSPSLISQQQASTIRVPTNTGPQTLVAGDLIRVYARSDSTAGGSKQVSILPAYVVTAGDVGAGFADILTVPILDDQPNLYTELGLAINKSAPVGLTGIEAHYGRLVGWKDDTVYVSKSSNADSWPAPEAQGDSTFQEAFRYTIGPNDGERIERCFSYQESLYVFKNTNIYPLGGIGPADDGSNAFSFRRIESNGIGCVFNGGKTVQRVGEESQNFLVFLSRNGFYATNGSSPNRIGEKIEIAVFPDSQDTTELTNAPPCSHYNKRDGSYLCFLGAYGNSTRNAWWLDTRKDNNVLVGWFKYLGVNASCTSYDEQRYLFGTNVGFCGYEKFSTPELTTNYSDARVEYVLAAAVNTVTDEITVTNNYATGDPVKIRTNGTIPAPLVANTIYYAINVSATVIKLATSSANALANIPIDLTTAGVGTHSIVSTIAISATYRTNWINFGSTSIVKKLGKPSVAFDVTANNVSMTVGIFYDWILSAGDAIVLSYSSSTLWGGGLWGSFVWGAGSQAVPKSLGIPRRKVRSISYLFSNDEINKGFDLQSLELPYAAIRNRDNFGA